MIAVYFNQSHGRRENVVEQEASTFAPKTFQEWPSVKQEYDRLNDVKFSQYASKRPKSRSDVSYKVGKLSMEFNAVSCCFF